MEDPGLPTVAAATGPNDKPPPSQPAPEDPDRVTLTIGGRAWQGWQDIRIARGCERVPNDFDLVVTEYFPGAGQIVIEPGQECQLKIGQDLVITGYVDRYSAGIAYNQHGVKISGRGRCQDLVDCSVITDGIGSQIGNAALLATAQRLAEPYGIQVTSRAGDAFIAETLGLFQTETPFDVIERLARSTGYLAYEGPDGNLILNRVSAERHATGFVEGANVERANVAFSMDARFSEYRVIRTALENLDDIASAVGNADWNRIDISRDYGVPRRRRRNIVVEQQFAGDDFAIRRGRWEMSRRYGRSQAVTLVVDSWRDGAGMLWEPNRLVRVHLPSLKLSEKLWCIGDVTYLRGPQGQRAEVVLMPPEAFEPQPTILQPFDNQVATELRAAQPANPRASETFGGV